MIHGTLEHLLDVWQIELDMHGLHWTGIPTNCLLMITETHSMVLNSYAYLLYIVLFSVYTIDRMKHDRTIFVGMKYQVVSQGSVMLSGQ